MFISRVAVRYCCVLATLCFHAALATDVGFPNVEYVGEQ